MWQIEQLLKILKGTPFRIERESFTGISTDSRSIKEGELFIPLSGINFDGHTFIPSAYDRSKAGSLCEKGREDIAEDVKGTIILVENTLKALIELAAYKRRQTDARYIAITGSNGKTTTKEILVHLTKDIFNIHFNEKNYNNVIGVSKSILSIDKTPDYCIFEFGTNSKGEIKTLAQMTMPDISMITNINPSHLEGLFDLDSILEEKLDLFRETKHNGTIFINVDDTRLLSSYKSFPKNTINSFGIIHNADFNLAIVEDLGWRGYNINLKLSSDTIKTKTSLLGIHNLYNVLAAASIAYSMGVGINHIAKHIESFNSYSMRFQPVESKRGYIVVNDTYNANPSSVQWAVKTLINLPCNGKRVVILSDMKELGDKTTYYHRELGRFLNENSVSMIALLGEHVKETYAELNDKNAYLFENRQELIDFVSGYINEGDVVLVKGSRLFKMEEIVEALI
ncbi:MAG TPA: UDP-N-acetylmuramoyl-tripeptide--D-alanyl-D-alanine ligase [Syntrophorhabdaceae bacterium]|jgi:UDP-N-acetylmuramoyl-tripeptide--D-alanyl-D-alanine ligase|nr:UDP-N-acetylmuramoyl-tripeptide--D-alanyl-D-alanine ligase [Syntrophorhabdaceae bacterium]MDI9561762.1 UDP-N-acetylmuramoyl-tripeptide--D-alanyl-D-alanine ligase [Pseudomonadota bacterium]OQC51151.1 MAG: UDP-N-acetylmuramoyl-tripeptide--D-alanyl-D-alanine ligase [Deltaproteobacteria bacterium ADurb.Bin026]MBP8698012.1 UDP-N-acetylmuramoyl-tripeptide--D-alanyl-D-alanine ligase [Syntrophorhabdaceae bacterium]MBV6506068.1 UDP-N-acetylmuramoyl-tripeptide--D-alanyl-D-alanine ligase [Syntrophorhab